MLTKLFLTTAALLFSVAQNGECQRTELSNALVCSETCRRTNNVYTYRTGEDYVYEIVSTHEQVHPTGETVTLSIKSTARIQALSECEFVLKSEIVEIKNVQDGKTFDTQSLKSKLEGQPLRFGWDDGRISNICPSRNDDLNSVNFKRGILSLLQVTMDDLQTPIYKLERDVAGDCYTEYRTGTGRYGSADIIKNKNIAGCSKRYKYISSVEGKAYDLAQEHSQGPFVNGEQSCALNIAAKGPLQSATCNETHWVQLPLRDKSPVITITQSIRLLAPETSKKIPTEPAYRTNILFEQPTEVPHLYEDLSNMDARTLLGMVESVLRYQNTETAAQAFLKVVHSLRQMSKEQLSSAVRSVNGASFNSEVRDVFYDALAMTQTEESVNFLVDYLLSSSRHAQTLVNSVLMSSVFIAEPSEAVLQSVEKLLNKDVYEGPALLTISTLARKFCNSRSDCLENEVIVRLNKRLVDGLKTSCKDKKDKAVMYLKALGNLGSSADTDALISTMKECIQLSGKDVVIEVAAHEALRPLACDAQVNGYLMKAFSESERCTEGRIKAYEALISCASEDDITSIVNTLLQEENQQVTSFVWSHLTAMADTLDPFKSTLRSQLQQVRQELSANEKNFNLDFRTHSRYYEHDFNLQQANGRMETSVIFGSNSFIPHHTRVNVTLTMYGRAVNILDVGLTTVGLDETFIKMRDYLLRTQGKDIKRKMSSAKLDSLKFESKVNPSISVSIKVFGHEVVFQQNILDNVNTMSLVTRLHQLFSGNKVQFSLKRNFVLSESVLTYPTMSGLPLHMQLSAAASIDLRLSSEMQKTPHLKFETQLVPKVSMYSVSRFFIDALTTKVGFYAESSTHSNISLGVGAEYKNGDFQKDGIRWRLFVSPAPQRQSIIAVKHDVIQYRDGKRPLGQKISPVQVQYQKVVCSGDILSSYVGVKTCLTYLPSSLQEKRTSFGYELSVEKFTGYVFHVEYLAGKGNRILPQNLVIKLGLESFSPRLVYLNFTDVSIKSSSNYALELQLLGLGRYFLKATSDSKNIFKGTIKKDNKDVATLTGFAKPDKIRWAFQEGKKDSVVFEMERGSKERKMKLEIKQRFPMTLKYVFNGDMRNVGSYSRGRHAVTVSLPNKNEFGLSISATVKEEGRERTLSAYWKTDNDFVLDYSGKYTLESSRARSADQSDIQGSLYRFHLSHELKGLMNNWPKTWAFSTSGSVFMSKSLYLPEEYTEPRLLETYFNWVYPKAKNQDTSYSLLLRMDPPNAAKGNYTFQSVVTFPNSAGPIRRKVQLAWRKAYMKDSEYIFQLLSERPGPEDTERFHVLAYHKTRLPETLKTKVKIQAFGANYLFKSDMQNLQTQNITIQLNKDIYESQSQIDVSSGIGVTVKQDIFINKVLVAKSQSKINYVNQFLVDVSCKTVDNKVEFNVVAQAEQQKRMKALFFYRDEDSYYRVKVDGELEMKQISIGSLKSITSTMKVTLQTDATSTPYVYERRLEVLSERYLFYFGIDVTSPSRTTDSLLFYVTHAFGDNKFLLQHQSLGTISYTLVALPSERQSSLCSTAMALDRQLDMEISISPFVYRVKKTIQIDFGCGEMLYVANGKYSDNGKEWSNFQYSFNYADLGDGGKAAFRVGATLKHDQLVNVFQIEEVKLSLNAVHKRGVMLDSKVQFHIVSNDRRLSHQYEANVNVNRQTKIGFASVSVDCPHINLLSNSSAKMLPDELKISTKSNWKIDGVSEYISAVLSGAREDATIFLDIKTSYSALKTFFIQLRSRTPNPGTSLTTNVDIDGHTFQLELQGGDEAGHLKWDSNLFTLKQGLLSYDVKLGAQREVTLKGEVRNKQMNIVSQLDFTSRRALDWSNFNIKLSLENRLLRQFSGSFAVARQPSQPVVYQASLDIPGKLAFKLKEGTFESSALWNGLKRIRFGYKLDVNYAPSSPVFYEERGDVIYSDYPLYISSNQTLNGKRISEFLLDVDARVFKLLIDSATEDSVVNVLLSLPSLTLMESTLVATLQVGQYIRRSTLRLDYFNGLARGEKTNRAADGQPSDLYLGVDLATHYESFKRLNLYLALAAKDDVSQMQTRLSHDIDIGGLFPEPMKGYYTASMVSRGSGVDIELLSNGQVKYKINAVYSSRKLQFKVTNVQAATVPLSFDMDHKDWTLPEGWNLQVGNVFQFQGRIGDESAFLQVDLPSHGTLRIDLDIRSNSDFSVRSKLHSVRSDLLLTANATIRFDSAKDAVDVQSATILRYSAWGCNTCVLRSDVKSTDTERNYAMNVQVLQNNIERLRVSERLEILSAETYSYRYNFEIKFPSVVDFSITSEHLFQQSSLLKIDVPNMNALLHLAATYDTGLAVLKFKAAGLNFDAESNLLKLARAIRSGNAEEIFPIGATYHVKINNAFAKLGRIASGSPQRVFLSEMFHPLMGTITSKVGVFVAYKKIDLLWHLTTPWSPVKGLNVELRGRQLGMESSGELDVVLDRGDGRQCKNGAKFLLNTDDMLVQCNVTHRGSLSVDGAFQMKQFVLSHTLEITDTEYEQLISRSESSCSPMSLIHAGIGACQFQEDNGKRLLLIQIENAPAYTHAEVAWNKKNNGFIAYHYSKPFGDPTATHSLSTPVRNVEVKVTRKNPLNFAIAIKTDHKSEAEKRAEFGLDVDWQSNEAGRQTKARFTSTMLKKPLLLTMTTPVEPESSLIQMVTMQFEGDREEFFVTKLQTLSSPDYPIAYNLLVDLNRQTWNNTLLIRLDNYKIALILQSPYATETYEVVYIPMRYTLIKADKHFKLEINTTQEDFVTKVQASLHFQPNDQTLDILLEHGTNPMKCTHQITTKTTDIRLNIRSVSPKAIRGDLTRTINGVERIQDAFLSITLGDDHFLRTEVDWRKGIWSTYQNVLLDSIEPSKLKRIYDYYVNAMQDRKTKFLSQFGKPFVEAMNLGEIVDYVKTLANDVEELCTIVRRGYDNDDFYLKTIFQSLGDVSLPNLSEGLSASLDASSEAMKQLGYGVEELFQAIYSIAQMIVENFDTKMAESCLKQLVDIIRDTREFVSTIFRSIFMLLEQTSTQIRSEGLNFADFLTSKLSVTLPKDMRNYFLDLAKRFSAMFMRFSDPGVKTWFREQVGALLSLRKELNQTTEDIKRLYADVWGDGTKRASTSDENLTARQILTLIARGKYYQAYDALFKPDATRIELDLAKGQVSLTAYVSPAFSDLANKIKSSSSYIPQQVFRAMNKDKKMVYRYYYYLDYIAQRYQSFEDVLTYFPPYSKSAWISQNLQYVSFDGVAGYLHNGCEVTLVKDIRGNRFGLSFKALERNSYLVMNVAGKFYHLYSNGTLTSQVKMELPLPYVDDLIVARRQGKVVRIALAGGLRIELHITSQNWHILAPGELHAHVDGLLGSNNYHSNDDFRLADGSLAVDNAARLRSWGSQACTPSTSTNEFPKAKNYDTPRDTLCSPLFDSPFSHLSRCYFAVNPKPYLQLCRNPATYIDSDYVCNLERAYVAACLDASVNVRVQRHCVQCNAVSKEGDTILTASTPRKDRYIFLVEDAACLASRKDFISKITDGLSSQSEGATEFHLLQFGDDTIQTVTMQNGEVTGDFRQFKAALHRVMSSPASQPSSSSAMKAIFEAINLETPSGYRDHLLLFACSSCAYDSQYPFARMSNLLQSSGIAFHYFTKTDFNSLSVKNIVGMDKTLIYRSVKSAITTQPRQKDIKLQQDACGPLAFESEGSIWSMDDIKNLPKLLTHINRRVKWHRALTSHKQTCVCRSDKFGNAEEECRHPAVSATSSSFSAAS